MFSKINSSVTNLKMPRVVQIIIRPYYESFVAYSYSVFELFKSVWKASALVDIPDNTETAGVSPFMQLPWVRLLLFILGVRFIKFANKR